MRWLLKLFPRWEVAFYFTIAASAGAQIMQGRAIAKNEAIRQQQLRNERKQAELAALDEENERLRMLDAANAEAIAGTGVLDPYASPSLLALRAANMRTANQDISNIRTNLATRRANIAARIRISKNTARSAWNSGLLNALGTMGAGIAKGQGLFGGGNTTATTSTPTLGPNGPPI